MTKSRDCKSVLVRGQASRPYSSTDYILRPGLRSAWDPIGILPTMPMS